MYDDFKKTILATNKNAQYDDAVKQLLSHKILLAHILVYTVDEFKGMNPEDVVELIEGEPKVSTVTVENGLTNSEFANVKENLNSENSGSLDAKCNKETTVNPDKSSTKHTNAEYVSSTDNTLNSTVTEQNNNTSPLNQKIIGYNTEASEIDEGLIRYDIIFYVMTKDGQAKIIINIEAQKNEPIKYDIINRAIFYVSRMISSQKTREFENTNYNDIKKVYSIWICMNIAEASLNHIHLVDDKKLGSYEWKGNLDLVNIIMIGLPKKVVKQEKFYELHRLLGTLLSMNMKADDKINIVKDEYKIKFDDSMRKEVDSMCNLSEGIYEQGVEVGKLQGIEVGKLQGIEVGKLQGIEVGKLQGIEVGLQKGAKEMISMGLEFGLSEEAILQRLQDKLSISIEKAKEYFEMFKNSEDTESSLN